MRLTPVALCLFLTFGWGCKKQQTHPSQKTTSIKPFPITHEKAREIATDHVNKKFSEHVWELPHKNQDFTDLSPEDWGGVFEKNERLFLGVGGIRGQEFTVSMKKDGTDVKIEKYGFGIM